jgi:toxin FitB
MMVGRGFLLDTNTISELQKPSPNPVVLKAFTSISVEPVYLSVLTIGELRRGDVIKRRRHPEMSSRYAFWIDSLEVEYADRILEVNRATATLWGQLTARRTPSVIDTLLAATAILHDLTLVTRNVRDIADLPVRILNPWLP